MKKIQLLFVCAALLLYVSGVEANSNRGNRSPTQSQATNRQRPDQSASQAQLSSSQRRRARVYRRPYAFRRHRAPPNKHSFTPAEKELILNIHNAYRSIVYPPAKDMRELVWDTDLENYARNHTQACTGAHSHRHMVKKWSRNRRGWRTWRHMGENLYYSYGSRYSIPEALWMFWEEGKDYDIQTNRCTHRNTCGHYKVMVNARSWRVGCAINRCERFSVSRYPTPAMFMSCIYNGAYVNSRKPYTVGQSCVNCTRRKLGYNFQYCRHRLCISPHLKYRNVGFNGTTTLLFQRNVG